MPQFERKSQYFAVNGVGLNYPIDYMPQDKFPILENLRSYQIGRLEARGGMTEVNSTAVDQLNVHSVKRLNDPLPSASQPYTRLLGAGTKLYNGTGSFATADTGYSGNPLALIPWRPDQSPDSWCYVYDSQRLRKINVAGLNYQQGIQAPLRAPAVNLALPYWSLIDNATSGGWTAGGTAGSVITTTRVPASTTIGSIVYDTGSLGWATIAPSNSGVNYAFLGELIFLTLTSEVVIISDVRAGLAATTIAAIAYDSGSTGFCCIQPAGSWTGLRRDSMVVIGGESIRVLSVTQAPDGSYSFRCSTSGTHAAADAITIPTSFRSYTSFTHAATAAITGLVLQTGLTGAGTGNISRVANFDLSSIAGRATLPDDYVHISVRIDHLEFAVEGRIEFDVDATTNDFTQNYFFKAFRANDFAAAATNSITVETARQIAIQRAITDRTTGGPTNPDNGALVANTGLPNLDTTISAQSTTGASQWTELIFRLSDLIQVGADPSRTLANVKAWRFSLTTSDTTAIQIGSLNYLGTYGPDQTIDENEILYRYRYRSLATGAKSTPGPATRSGILPNRALALVTTIASTDPQVDVIDIERFGGELSDWHYVGTIPNGTGPFNDFFDGQAIASNPPLEVGGLLPFPSIDIPRSGTCTIVGNSVTQTGGADTFNTSWAPGTPIKINGTVYTLYGQPSSTTALQIVESGNFYSGVPFQVDEPVLIGQPLPYAWGPSNNFIFAVGDPRQPGTVRFTKGNDPDASPEHYFVELTSPSDPLMNGVLYDGRSLVASTQRWFDLRPNQDLNNPIISQELPIDRGLFAPWAICVGGGKVWFLSDDGIYFTTGSGAQSITFKDLRPLFPHDDQPAIAVNGFNPPDFTAITKLRLSWASSWLFFDYQDTNGDARTLAYDTVLDAWWPDYFTPGVGLHYGDEGESLDSLILCGNDGRVYTFGGVSDNGTDIACHARTASMNYDDPRTRKLFGDLYLDSDTQSVDVAVTAGFNNYETLLTPFILNTATRAQNSYDLLAGLGQLAMDIALDFAWTSSGATPLLYLWACTLVNKPELSLKRATDWDDAGAPNQKYVRAILIEADTLGTDRTVTILKDGGVDSNNSLTVNHNGQELLPYPLTPFNSHLMRVYPTDADQWQLFRVTWIFDPYPEQAAITGTWTDAGYPGDKFFQGVRLRADSNNAKVDVQIEGDSGVLQKTINAQHNGQEIKPYSWDNPFIAHLVRTVPLGAISIWDFPQTDWVYEPAPELTEFWITQPTTHDLQGFGMMRWCYIALMSNADVTFQIITEAGQSVTFIVPNTNGAYKKVYYTEFILNTGTWPLKGRAWSYRFSGGPFRLFVKDCEVGIKAFGSVDPFVVKNPFGDVSRVAGARI